VNARGATFPRVSANDSRSSNLVGVGEPQELTCEISVSGAQDCGRHPMPAENAERGREVSEDKVQASRPKQPPCGLMYSATESLIVADGRDG